MPFIICLCQSASSKSSISSSSSSSSSAISSAAGTTVWASFRRKSEVEMDREGRRAGRDESLGRATAADLNARLEDEARTDRRRGVVRNMLTDAEYVMVERSAEEGTELR